MIKPTKDEIIERQEKALNIAAKELVDKCVCRYDDITKCRRFFVDPTICERCVKKGLLSKAKRELKKELKNR